ncbi:MAG: rhodanese-like domain-containing protein [Nitrospirales bacterium]
MMETTLEKQDLTPPNMKQEPRFADVQQGKEQMFIDVRTPGEFEEAHIPGSRNIPLTDFQSFLPELIEVAKIHELTLVCRTQNRVKLAYGQLMNEGVRNCRILEGGVTRWIAEGKPITWGRKGISLEGQVRMAAGTLTVIGVLLGVIVSPWLLVVPAAVGAGLIHAGWTNSCLMGMWLGKLPFNRIKRTQ